MSSEHDHRHDDHGERRTLRHYAQDFIRNLRASDASFATKVRLTLRNRVRAFSPPVKGCCGHPGEPGC